MREPTGRHTAALSRLLEAISRALFSPSLALPAAAPSSALLGRATHYWSVTHVPRRHFRDLGVLPSHMAPSFAALSDVGGSHGTGQWEAQHQMPQRSQEFTGGRSMESSIIPVHMSLFLARRRVCLGEGERAPRIDALISFRPTLCLATHAIHNADGLVLHQKKTGAHSGGTMGKAFLMEISRSPCRQSGGSLCSWTDKVWTSLSPPPTSHSFLSHFRILITKSETTWIRYTGKHLSEDGLKWLKLC